MTQNSKNAWIVAEQLPPVEIIEEFVKEVIANKFSMLNLVGSKGFWHVGYKGDPHLTIHFWRENDQKIQFIHRDNHPFCWWIEYEVREFLADKCNGMVWYDDVDASEPPQKTSYNNFRQYLEGVFGNMTEFVSDVLDTELPKELLPYKGSKW